MNLNSRVWHCVLTLIYSLYKWVNKYVGKKRGGLLEKAHHCPTREETEGGGGFRGGECGLKCNLLAGESSNSTFSAGSEPAPLQGYILVNLKSRENTKKCIFFIENKNKHRKKQICSSSVDTVKRSEATCGLWSENG